MKGSLLVTPHLEIRLLGDFLLLIDGRPMTLSGVARLQSLLAYLVLHRSAPQDRSRLAFLLWPDSTDAQAHTNLRKLLHQLRQAVPDIDMYLHADRHNLHWVEQQPGAERGWRLDVQEFEVVLARAERIRGNLEGGESAEERGVQLQALEQAVELYGGELLPDCYDEWLLAERDRLHQAYIHAAEQLMDLLEQQRAYEGAIKIAQQLVRTDPLHEATYRALMRFYALSGDRASALRAYHTCATTLERELGVEPSEVTRRSYEALMRVNTSTLTHDNNTGVAPRSSGTQLVGRREEWARLQSVWNSVTHGHPQVVVLSGEAGIGKTRLAEEMTTWVGRQGFAQASARCYAVEGELAYAPVTAWLQSEGLQNRVMALEDIWLTEVARLLPDLLTRKANLPRPGLMRESWQRQRFFEALARALLRVPGTSKTKEQSSGEAQALLILLDDMQWCDEETLEWLHYLLRFEPHAPLLVLGTIRSEELTNNQALVSLLTTLRRDGQVTELALGPLTANETAALAEHIAGRELAQTIVSGLFQETEGHPLFVVETVRAGGAESALPAPAPEIEKATHLERRRAEEPIAASKLPSRVQTILAARLEQLTPKARELAGLAAVIGREFSFSVLARCRGESEDEMVEELDELWQRRIVREQGGEMYDFSHDKLREQAYLMLSSARRRLLHRRVAEALEKIYAHDLDRASKLIAVQYERAGLIWIAIPYYQRAGHVAWRVYANAEAVASLQQAVALLEAAWQANREEQPQRAWELAAQLYQQLGDMLGAVGRFAEGRHAYKQGIQRVPQQEALWLARFQRKIAKSWLYAPDIPALFRGYQEAERTLEQAQDKESIEWQREWLEIQIDRVLPLAFQMSPDQLTATIEKLRPVVERSGTEAQQAQFVLAIALRDYSSNHYIITDEILTSYRAALPIVQQTGSRNLIAFARFGLGTVLMFAGYLDEAEKQIRVAIQTGEEMGNFPLLERALSFLPFLYRRRGQVEEVRKILAQVEGWPRTIFAGVYEAHRAWLAWQDGHLKQAEQHGKNALEEWQRQRQIYPFQWAALWPLLDIMLTQQRFAEAVKYASMLLNPALNPMPDSIRVLLTSAIELLDHTEEREERAKELTPQEQVAQQLCEAMMLAQKLGYA